MYGQRLAPVEMEIQCGQQPDNVTLVDAESGSEFVKDMEIRG